MTRVIQNISLKRKRKHRSKTGAWSVNGTRGVRGKNHLEV